MSTVKKLCLGLGLGAAVLAAGCGGDNSQSAAEAASQQSSTSAQGSLSAEGARSAEGTSPAEGSTKPAAAQFAMDVYKSETCGCCQGWIDYMEERDYPLTVHHPADLAAEKQRLGIAARYQSCHTAVTADGYVFEGHIPAKTVEQFLAEKPEGAIGLAVPGMPVGSPGMEMGDRFSPYDVLLLKEDGSSEVYASFRDAAAQH